MMNQSYNFAFIGMQYPIPSFSSIQPFPSINYQQFPYQSWIFMDQNNLLSSYQTFATYKPQPFLGNQMTSSVPSVLYPSLTTEENYQIQNSNPADQLHFYTGSGKFNTKTQQLPIKLTGAFSYCNFNQENQRLSRQIEMNAALSPQTMKKELNNQSLDEDKRTVQNLRYQRKNIQANIVNKIYTYLKTILKFGQKSLKNLIQDKEKSSVYLKVIQKLQKARRQIIKRQFLKELICIDRSLPGYSKAIKQLQKRGHPIQQFEYYIRIIIKYFLKAEIPNSILTSKKMNPSLWIEHLRKVREIEEYLFAHLDKESSN